jgi:thiol-disulfide isomerase/thioredoxin
VLPDTSLMHAAARRHLLAGVAGSVLLGTVARIASAVPDDSLGTAPVLSSIDGSPLLLQLYLGRPLLLNLWATWCAPCVAEMPALQALRLSQGPARSGLLEVVALNAGQSINQVEGFLKEHALQLPVVMDQKKLALARWNIRMLPTTLLFDADGRLRSRWTGERQWSGATMLQEIEAALRLAPETRAGT